MAQKVNTESRALKKAADTARVKTPKKSVVEEPQLTYSVSPDGCLDRSHQNKKTVRIGQDPWTHSGRMVTGLKRVQAGISPLRDLKRELVTIDSSGRMVLPKKIREQFPVNRFEVKVTENRIELLPIEPLRSLLGSSPEIDLEKIYREHDREVDEEDEE